MRQKNIWLVGGDERQALLAGLLADDGHAIHVYGMERRISCEPTLEGVGAAHCVILPLPALGAGGMLNTPLSDRKLPAGELLRLLKPGQAVLAGKAGPWLRAAAEALELKLTDYYAREELALLNAIPTAEGAIRIAAEILPVTIHTSRILILGYGRLGQALAPRLRALGARVCVAERSPDRRALAAMHNLHCEGTDALREQLHRFELVVNTIPARVLGVEELAAMKEGAVVIDLASLPGGTDDESAAALGIRVIHALALPGKEAPLTAARYLRDTVYHLMMGV